MMKRKPLIILRYNLRLILEPILGQAERTVPTLATEDFFIPLIEANKTFQFFRVLQDMKNTTVTFI